MGQHLPQVTRMSTTHTGQMRDLIPFLALALLLKAQPPNTATLVTKRHPEFWTEAAAQCNGHVQLTFHRGEQLTAGTQHSEGAWFLSRGHGSSLCSGQHPASLCSNSPSKRNLS